jgi:hypothetical protein
MADFSRPGAALRGQFACKLFVDLPRMATMIALEEGGARLEMHVDGTKISRVGIWINQGGWTPFEKTSSLVPSFLRRRHAYSNLSVQPCIGAPDSLTDALGAWDSADWVEPRGSATWSMKWRGTRVEEA